MICVTRRAELCILYSVQSLTRKRKRGLAGRQGNDAGPPEQTWADTHTNSVWLGYINTGAILQAVQTRMFKIYREQAVQNPGLGICYFEKLKSEFPTLLESQRRVGGFFLYITQVKLDWLSATVIKKFRQHNNNSNKWLGVQMAVRAILNSDLLVRFLYVDL